MSASSATGLEHHPQAGASLVAPPPHLHSNSASPSHPTFEQAQVRRSVNAETPKKQDASQRTPISSSAEGRHPARAKELGEGQRGLNSANESPSHAEPGLEPKSPHAAGVVGSQAAASPRVVNHELDAFTLPLPPRPGVPLEMHSAQNDSDGVGQKEGPVLPNGNRADFFPWTGTHPEDVLSEATVKSGFFDRVPLPGEIDTCMPVLSPYLKHYGGLQNFSRVLGLLFEKRQERGRITTPSSFKPPPRVTLTDTKREAWLRDLANPTVPLRKLSRTIPHGIRGKALLEQSLAKRIPLSRAVWLAKCVGANEIRAFKRKGVSGAQAHSAESKWVKDWTVSMEQFVEDIVGEYGHQDYRTKINYALRLTSRLYFEGLLDQDHYLEWITVSIEGSDKEHLPFWLLMIQLQWKNLVSTLERGRRLTEALLSHLKSINAEPAEVVFQMVKLRLQQMILVLATAHNGCMILPRTWETYRSTVTTLGTDCPTSQDLALKEVIRRNERFCNHFRLDTAQVQSENQKLLGFLDNIRYPIDIRAVHKRCLEIHGSPTKLASSILSWATSKHRVGRSRMYLAVRLLRLLCRDGLDINELILDSFCRFSRTSDKTAMYDVVAELTRSRHFCVGRYLKWFIANGMLAEISLKAADTPIDRALQQPFFTSATIPCRAELVLQLPTRGLPAHVSNLRRALLQSAQISDPSSPEFIETVKQHLATSLPDVFSAAATHYHHIKESQESILSHLPAGARMEIGYWIRQRFASFSDTTDPNVDEHLCSDSPTARSFTLDDKHLCVVRGWLEGLRDMPILADVLGLAMTSTDGDVLASICDTLNTHLESFAAIGALKPLFEDIIDRHRVLRLMKPATRRFLIALIDLATHIRVDQKLLAILKQDLKMCETRSENAACSPVADDMVDALGTAKGNFDDEVERLLASGTSMDKQTLARIFENIMSRVQIESRAESRRTPNIGTLLAKLRGFDEECFDSLLSAWLEKVLHHSPHVALTQVIPALVASQCISIQAVIAYFERLLQKTVGDGIRDDQTCQNLMGLLVAREDGSFMSIQDAYRFMLQKQAFCFEYPHKVLELLLALTDTMEFSVATSFLAAQLTNKFLVEVLKQLVVSRRSHSIEEAVSSNHRNEQRRSAIVIQILEALLGVNHGTGSHDLLSSYSRLIQVIASVDAVSLPFCASYARLFMRYNVQLDDPQTEVLEQSLARSVGELVNNGSDVWADVAASLGPRVAGRICDLTEAALLLDLDQFICGNTSISDQDVHAHRKHLDVLELALALIHPEVLNDKTQLLVEEVHGLVRFIHDSEPVTGDGGFALSATEPGGQAISHWVDVITRMLVLYNSAFIPTTGGSGNTTDSLRSRGLMDLLRALSYLLVEPRTQHLDQAMEKIHDTIAFFLEPAQSEEFRHSLLQHLGPDLQQDPRIKFLYGIADKKDAWLHVVTPSAPSLPSTSLSNDGSPRPQESTNQEQQPQADQTSIQVTRHSSPSPSEPSPAPQSRSGSQSRSEASSPPPPPPPATFKIAPYAVRHWELLPQDLPPLPLPPPPPPTANGQGSQQSNAENDTSISLRLFCARRVVET